MKKTTGREGAMAELLSKHNSPAVNDKPVKPNAVSERELQMRKRNSIMEEIHRSEEDLGGASEPKAIPREPVVQREAVREARPESVPVRPQPRRKAPVNKPHVQKAPAVKAQKPAPKAPAASSKTKKKLTVAIGAVFGVLVATACIVGAIMISLSGEETKKAPEVSLGAAPSVSTDKLPVVTLSEHESATKLQQVSFNIFGGEPLTCLTAENTVGALVDEAGIEMTESQFIREDTQSATKDGMVISIDTVTYGTETKTEYTDYGTQYVDVRTIPKGTTKTQSAGVKGETVYTYTITYVNGVETGRELTGETVTKYAQDAVVYRGVGGYINVGGKQYSYSYYIDCKTTVYCLKGITASGAPVSEDVIAVDPSVIPLGTKVFVDDSYTYVGFRTAADTGGAIKGNFIDIWYDPSDTRFYSYGVRSARVYILD